MHFNDFLGTLNFKHKIVIAGNHDLTLDKYNKKDIRQNNFYNKIDWDVDK